MDWDVDIIARLIVATVLGAMIGWEREVMNRAAGFRTHILVSVGSALFTILSLTSFHEVGKVNDPARLAAQVVSGIGFLGAGTIIKDGGSVRGLTTAATLWVVAAIGMAAGAGAYMGAFITTIMALTTLVSLRLFESHDVKENQLNITLTFAENPQKLDEVKSTLNRYKLQPTKLKCSHREELNIVAITANKDTEFDNLLLLQDLQTLGALEVNINE